MPRKRSTGGFGAHPGRRQHGEGAGGCKARIEREQDRPVGQRIGDVAEARPEFALFRACPPAFMRRKLPADAERPDRLKRAPPPSVADNVVADEVEGACRHGRQTGTPG